MVPYLEVGSISYTFAILLLWNYCKCKAFTFTKIDSVRWRLKLIEYVVTFKLFLLLQIFYLNHAFGINAWGKWYIMFIVLMTDVTVCTPVVMDIIHISMG